MAALDFPNSPTTNQIYAAPNGVSYMWDGAAWVVTGGPPGQLWTGTATSLVPTDTTKTVTVPGDATGGGGVLIGGTRTAKTRVVSSPTIDAGYLMLNRDMTVVDTPSLPAWHMAMNASNDVMAVGRAPAGSGVSATNLMTIDGAGKMTLPGPTAAATDVSQAQLGTRTMKGRLYAPYAGDQMYVGYNGRPDGTNWNADNAGAAGWLLALNGAADRFQVLRAPASAIQTYAMPFYVNGADGKTYCTLADASVTRAMMAPAASWRGGPPGVACPVNITYNNATYMVCQTASYTPRAGTTVMISGILCGHYAGATVSTPVYFGWGRDGTVQRWFRYDFVSGQGIYFAPLPAFLDFDFPTAAAHTWSLHIQPTGTGGSFVTSADNAGVLSVIELS